VDVDTYLARIGYRGALSPAPDTLRRLQLAHLLTVPFENLSIHHQEPIILDDDALFAKIVGRRRGGFCYELNGLFAALLRSCGMDVVMVAAEVANAEQVFGPPFDHMALVVSLEQRWLVDVGFGDSFREPLLLDQGGEQQQGNRGYRIEPDGDYLVLLQREGSADWKMQYRFTLKAHTYADYAGMCHYHQTSPQSHFTRARVCSRATEDGRITLRGTRFITSTLDGERYEQALESEDEAAAILRERFGIVMRP
jgi:N-hydroxyarylamine O-acetyltransferase